MTQATTTATTTTATKYRTLFYVTIGIGLLLLILGPGVSRHIARYHAMEQALNQRTQTTTTITDVSALQMRPISTRSVANTLPKTTVPPIKTPMASADKTSAIQPDKIAVATPVTIINRTQNPSKSMTTKPRSTDIAAKLPNVTPADVPVTALVQDLDIEPLDAAIDSAVGIDVSDSTGPFADPTAALKQPPALSKANQVSRTKEPVLVKKSQRHLHRTVIIHPAKIVRKSAEHRMKKLRYAVQIASFSQRHAADKLARRLRHAGYQTVVQSLTIKHNRHVSRVFVLAKKLGKIAATRMSEALFERYKINGYVRKTKV